MRILHTADLHLGRQFNGLSLEADQQDALDQVLAAIHAHGPELLIVAGDVFDRAQPPASAQRQFNDFLRRVAATKTAVAIISGNHDGPDRIEAMAAFTDPARALIRGAATAEEPPMLLHDAHGPVAVSALPFVYEHAAREALGDPSIATPHDVIAAQMAAARRAVPEGARHVVVAHAFVAGGAAGETERPLAVGGIETVDAAAFDGAHYVALGHLHRPQHVTAPHIRYSGAPLAFGFDEAGAAKSMSLVELGPEGVARIEELPFTPLRAVRLLRGTMAELLALPQSDDIVAAELTDDAPPVDPMRRLREVFPNACRLTHLRSLRAPEAKSALAAPERPADPMEVLGGFLETVRGIGPDARETELLARALGALKRKEDEA
ncbi:exonuclease SbcCD subunit D [Rhodovulum sp. DZ06]|uniref:exonuclease SbcCD subunit D n=1 Tax=Rhodovulum sp. DZ06 TaxID=3425126 RepID=UPI003D33426C